MLVVTKYLHQYILMAPALVVIAGHTSNMLHGSLLIIILKLLSTTGYLYIVSIKNRINNILLISIMFIPVFILLNVSYYGDALSYFRSYFRVFYVTDFLFFAKWAVTFDALQPFFLLMAPAIFVWICTVAEFRKRAVWAVLPNLLNLIIASYLMVYQDMRTSALAGSPIPLCFGAFGIYLLTLIFINKVYTMQDHSPLYLILPTAASAALYTFVYYVTYLEMKTPLIFIIPLLFAVFVYSTLRQKKSSARA